MPFKEGDPKPEGSGRKAGVPNKATSEAKAALEQAFEGVGGVIAFTNWARENQTEFYKLWSKLLPKDMNISATQTLGDVLAVMKNTEEKLD